MTDGPNDRILSSSDAGRDQIHLSEVEATAVVTLNGTTVFNEEDESDGDTATLSGDLSSGPPTPKAQQNGFASPIAEVAVGNLIDFSDSSSSEESNRLGATLTQKNLRRIAVMPGVTANGDRLAPASPAMTDEQSFEGVASGHSNGTSSLLDSPVDPVRPSTSSSPTSPMQNGLPSFTPGHRKAPSASQLASHLFTQGRSTYSNGSRRSSFNSDVENMSVSDAELHSEVIEISSQVQKIQKQLANFEEHHLVTDDKHARLKQENAVLQERLHALDEKVQETEERWREKYSEEKQRSKDLLARLEREKNLETESLALKFQILEKDHANCEKEKEKLTENLEKLRLQNCELKEKNEELNFQSKRLEEDFSETEREFQKYQSHSEAELERKDLVLEEMSDENRKLRDLAGRPRQMSIADRASDIQDELHSLREQYRELQERNDELHAELLHAQVETGRTLLADGPSLASEMGGKDKDELINELKQQEVCNQKLRAYIEGILIRVIEKHPDILEVKH